MKETKFILYTLYVAAYTSACWIFSLMLHSSPQFGNSQCNIPLDSYQINILCIFIWWSSLNILLCLKYVIEHWYDE